MPMKKKKKKKKKKKRKKKKKKKIQGPAHLQLYSTNKFLNFIYFLFYTTSVLHKSA